MAEIVKIEGELWNDYSAFLTEVPEAMLYYSKPYHDLLLDHLGCEAHYFAAKHDGKIVAVLPMMLSKVGSLGRVANSLPFYGSNGSILFGPNIEGEACTTLSAALLDHATQYAITQDCCAYTFIDNPLAEKTQTAVKSYFDFDPTDYRIGQITPLPEYQEEGYDAVLMGMLQNPRPRNVRKAIKSGVTVRASNAQEDMDFLFKVHQDNIQAIGGISKEKSFFDAVVRIVPHDLWKVYVAMKDGEPIAALLLFYFNETVEYFTPATIHDYRNLQPSAVLIFEAMKAAAQQGFNYWNWGGTWKTQTGVYDFKKKWGAADHEYYYYTTVLKEEVLSASRETLLTEYPYFYVVSFSQLKEDE